MNDKDFDQIFSDKLNEVSEFSGADDNWQKLKFRLDLVPPATVLPTPAPALTVPTIGAQPLWMYAAMSALAVGNIWLWLQMRDVNRQNEALQKAVVAVQANRKDTVYRIDTIYQKVYLMDNPSNSDNSTAITPEAYAALSTRKGIPNAVAAAASSPAFEAKNLKNPVSIEVKKQQNIEGSPLNRSEKVAKALNNTIAAHSKAFNGAKKVDNAVLSNSLNGTNATKRVDKTAPSKVSNEKKVENIVEEQLSTDNEIKKSANNLAPISVLKDTKSMGNSTSNPFIGNDEVNSAIPKILELETPQTVTGDEVQNKMLNKANLLLLPLDFKPLLPIETAEKEQEVLNMVGVMKPITVKQRRNILPKWSMPEVNIGIVGATGLPNKYETSGLGLGTDIGWSRNWSVIASLEKHESHFDMKARDKRFHLPPDPVNVPRDRRLMELEGDFKDFRLSVGAKYVFMTSKKFRPYVLAQHVWKKAPPSFVAFKYEKPGGDREDYIQTIDSKSFANIWQLGAGMTGDFNHRLSWNAGLNYMFDLNTTNLNTNPLTLRAGLYYRL
jgi:Outer membrane protein beta-barrel domain